MIYGIAQDGVIVNALEAETLEIAQAVAPEGAEVIEGAAIGAVLVDGEWIVPEPEATRRTLSGLEFEMLVQQAAGLSDAEVLATLDDPNLRLFWHRLNRAAAIEYDHPVVAQGLGALVATGHLTEAQKDAVMAAWPAE